MSVIENLTRSVSPDFLNTPLVDGASEMRASLRGSTEALTHGSAVRCTLGAKSRGAKTLNAKTLGAKALDAAHERFR